MATTLELLEMLVGIDTTAGSSNLALIAAVEARLDDHGVAHQWIPSADGTRANLLARIGPAVEGGVVLSGHTDCVPVAGQPWSHDPFALHADGDRLYGRGTADMKGFLAAVLGRLPTMAEADLARPVLLALSYDEEVGTLGAPSLVERLLATQPRPAAAVVGEPTGMQVVAAHKGVRSYTVVVRGRDGHSSQPHRTANAVAAAARIATFVDDLADRLRDAGGDPRFDPPHTTFNLATLHGGQAINIVPRHCELAFEYRPVPADDSSALGDEVEAFARDEVLPRLRGTAGDGAVEFRRGAVVPTLAAEVGGYAEELVRRLTGDDGPDRTVSFGTDGGHYQAAGLSTVVCGPGSIDQAHQPDEYVEAAQLDGCEAFLDGLIDELAR